MFTFDLNGDIPRYVMGYDDPYAQNNKYFIGPGIPQDFWGLFKGKSAEKEAKEDTLYAAQQAYRQGQIDADKKYMFIEIGDDDRRTGTKFSRARELKTVFPGLNEKENKQKLRDDGIYAEDNMAAIELSNKKGLAIAMDRGFLPELFKYRPPVVDLTTDSLLNSRSSRLASGLMTPQVLAEGKSQPRAFDDMLITMRAHRDPDPLLTRRAKQNNRAREVVKRLPIEDIAGDREAQKLQEELVNQDYLEELEEGEVEEKSPKEDKVVIVEDSGSEEEKSPKKKKKSRRVEKTVEVVEEDLPSSNDVSFSTPGSTPISSPAKTTTKTYANTPTNIKTKGKPVGKEEWLFGGVSYTSSALKRSQYSDLARMVDEQEKRLGLTPKNRDELLYKRDMIAYLKKHHDGSAIVSTKQSLKKGTGTGGSPRKKK